MREGDGGSRQGEGRRVRQLAGLLKRRSKRVAWCPRDGIDVSGQSVRACHSPFDTREPEQQHTLSPSPLRIDTRLYVLHHGMAAKEKVDAQKLEEYLER